ncbi:MAG: SLC13 family permease [Chloroflexota bacterium]
MDPTLTSPQLTLIAILVGTLALLMTEWIRIDVTAVLVILALSATQVLDSRQALSGFSSSPALVAAAVFVLGEALFRTGLSDRMGANIGRLAGRGQSRTLIVLMLSTALLSAFTHHLTITAVMLPVTLKVCREQNISPSKLLIPMSLAASLGTTITIVGAPAFLLADGVLRQAGRAGLGIFSIAPIGLTLSAAGTLFMLLVGRFLLPERGGNTPANNHFRLDGYYTEVILLAGSPLLGKTVSEVEATEGREFKVVARVRNGRLKSRQLDDSPLQERDVLLVRTTPDQIAAIQKEPGIALHPVTRYGDQLPSGNGKADKATEQLVQAVIAPGSDLMGRTIGQVNFLEQYGVVVVSLWRRQGWLRTQLSRVRLREGDVLVMLGDEAAFRRVSADRSFLMMLPFEGVARLSHKAPLAGFIMVASILAVALNLLPIEIALLAGAAAVVLTGCLTPGQAYRAIDTRIYVFIAGAIPLGLAMETTGTSDWLAGRLQALVQSWGPHPILLSLFAVSALVTQLMSDAGTTALLAPVAVALARLLNAPPEPYVVAVAMAAVTSFLTPIGHHGNLLVYGPGRYRFRDFVLVGVPLTLIVAILVTWLTPILWPS